MSRKFKRILIVTVIATIPILLFLSFQYISKATLVKANITVDVKQTSGVIPSRWMALAQGGEEKGVRMLENIVPALSALNPRSIRLDHIYDYYDVVKRESDGTLSFHWDQLDATVCDIYRTGAKPFFSLGYMPPEVSSDGSLISQPKEWGEWSLIVQKTIERYSGQSTRLCGQIEGEWLKDIHYEVWNEPDLETFGKWSLYTGEKDYKKLYLYSVLGAEKAQNVYSFLIGGPVTTALYQNWIQMFLNYVIENNLRLDFLSWHHYSKSTEDYTDDIGKINEWLSDSEQYVRFQSLPKIISEWGYDSEPNSIADTNVGAAHTIASIRNFSRFNFDMAFLFEAKDGPAPRWGILSHTGEKKPRYHALKLLTLLQGNRLNVEGEGTYVRGMAGTDGNKTVLILVNYDKDNRNTELIPVTFTNLENGAHTLTLTYLDGTATTFDNVVVENNQLNRSILAPPNTVVATEVKKL